MGSRDTLVVDESNTDKRMVEPFTNAPRIGTVMQM